MGYFRTRDYTSRFRENAGLGEKLIFEKSGARFSFIEHSELLLDAEANFAAFCCIHNYSYFCEYVIIVIYISQKITRCCKKIDC